MSVKICSQGSDREFDEIQSWPVQMAMGYFTLVYITRSPLFTIIFGYFWESFELLVLVLNQKFLQDRDSKFAQWFVNSGPFSWIIPPSSDEKARPCVENPMTSLFFDPLIFVTAACLWSIGVEKLVGAKYDQMRAFGRGMQRFIYYTMIAFTFLFASRIAFVHSIYQLKTSGPSDSTDGFNPDLGLIMVTIISITLTAFIPVRSGQRNGFDSAEARRAYYAYIVYVIFVLVIVVFGVLAGPFINVRSAWIRAFMALGILWFACLLVAGVRVGIWLNSAVGEEIIRLRTADDYVAERRKQLSLEEKIE